VPARVTAGPAICARPDRRPHIGLHQTRSSESFVRCGDADRAERSGALLSARSMLRTTMGFYFKDLPQRSGTVADMPRHRSSERRCYGCPGCPGVEGATCS
jgi:hypothetical protein